MKICLILLAATLALSSAAVQHNRHGVNNNYYGSASHTTKAAYHHPNIQQKYNNYNTHSNNDKDMKTLRNEQDIKEDGSYRYAYETENGIVGEESGVGGVSVQGSSSYISPEGIEIKTTYVADETGYHPVGDHIPKTPDYILRALEYIRTHPFKNSKDYESVTKKSYSNNQYKVNTNIAPPTRKTTYRQQQQQQPAKVTAKGKVSSTHNYRANSYKFRF